MEHGRAAPDQASGWPQSTPDRCRQTVNCNIEIKAHLPEPERLIRQLRAMTGRDGAVIEQDDAFYACPHGRLKLRRFNDGSGELIQYERSDGIAPRPSNYRRIPATDPQTLHDALTAALGLIGRVRKRRLLFLLGRTRVHVDHVEGLGHFVELEVVLNGGEDPSAGEQEADALMQTLGILPENCIGVAYLDLIRNKA